MNNNIGKSILSLFLFCISAWIAAQDMVVINKTEFIFVKMLSSAIDSDEWSDDLIPENAIISGESLKVPLDRFPAGEFNLLLEDEDGDQYIKYKIERRSGKKIVVTMEDHLLLNEGEQGEGIITFVNKSGETIRQLFISPKNGEFWGSDLLNGSYLYVNSQWQMQLGDYGDQKYFDIRYHLNDSGRTVLILKDVYLSPRARVLLKGSENE